MLSHSAATTVHSFPGYVVGQDLPNLAQVLAGTPPANSPPVEVFAMPGRGFQYSGGGYCILQQAVEDVTGRRFVDLARKLVLEPLAMHNSTFAHELPPDLAARAAIGHRDASTPIPGGWHVYPEHAAASLWVTPTDLAHFALAIMASLEGAPGALLERETARQMTSPRDPAGTYGLGFYLGDDGGKKVYFLHGGANEGYRCGLVVYPRFRQAVAIMTNADGGQDLWREVLRSVSIEYGWVD